MDYFLNGTGFLFFWVIFNACLLLIAIIDCKSMYKKTVNMEEIRQNKIFNTYSCSKCGQEIYDMPSSQVPSRSFFYLVALEMAKEGKCVFCSIKEFAPTTMQKVRKKDNVVSLNTKKRKGTSK